MNYLKIQYNGTSTWTLTPGILHGNNGRVVLSNCTGKTIVLSKLILDVSTAAGESAEPIL